MLTFIRLCQSLCIDIDTWMHQPHSSRGKLSINVENNVIAFQDCRLYAHHCSVLCAIHAERKMSSPHFRLGAKWQARIFHLMKRWLCVWPCCHLLLFFFFLLAQLKVQNRGRESKPFSSYTQRDDVMWCVCACFWRLKIQCVMKIIWYLMKCIMIYGGNVHNKMNTFN